MARADRAFPPLQFDRVDAGFKELFPKLFGGGHAYLELTGEDVTECTGGARDLSENNLKRANKSRVDPRLNYEQSLELAMLIVRKHSLNTA